MLQEVEIYYLLGKALLYRESEQIDAEDLQAWTLKICITLLPYKLLLRAIEPNDCVKQGYNKRPMNPVSIFTMLVNVWRVLERDLAKMIAIPNREWSESPPPSSAFKLDFTVHLR